MLPCHLRQTATLTLHPEVMGLLSMSPMDPRPCEVKDGVLLLFPVPGTGLALGGHAISDACVNEQMNESALLQSLVLSLLS